MIYLLQHSLIKSLIHRFTEQVNGTWSIHWGIASKHEIYFIANIYSIQDLNELEFELTFLPLELYNANELMTKVSFYNKDGKIKGNVVSLKMGLYYTVV